MQYTSNKNLKKPELTDFYNIGDFNDNFDALDKLGDNVDTYLTRDSDGNVSVATYKVGGVTKMTQTMNRVNGTLTSYVEVEGSITRTVTLNRDANGNLTSVTKVIS